MLTENISSSIWGLRMPSFTQKYSPCYVLLHQLPIHTPPHPLTHTHTYVLPPCSKPLGRFYIISYVLPWFMRSLLSAGQSFVSTPRMLTWFSSTDEMTTPQERSDWWGWWILCCKSFLSTLRGSWKTMVRVRALSSKADLEPSVIRWFN